MKDLARDEELMTATDVARRWKTTPHFVLGLARQKRLACIRFGRRKGVRFRLSDVVAYEEQRFCDVDPITPASLMTKRARRA